MIMTRNANSKDHFLDIGSVESLTVLPLIDFYAVDPNLKTEPGVSYLIKADGATILMDVGFNKKKEHPSPLIHNMEALGVSLTDPDYLFISHLHLDHVGGLHDQKNGTFSLSQGPQNLPEIPVFTPVPIRPSAWNPRPKTTVIEEPVKLTKGVASTGPVERRLFLMGPVKEHSLAVNVKGKGIVIIIGCGHQTVERIIDDARADFDEPIYGIIGGLHFPVHGGRINIGPLNLQNIAGTDKKPWRGGITEDDVEHAVKAVQSLNPGCVALSPHDSSDWSIERFKAAFGDVYHDLKVGLEIKI